MPISASRSVLSLQLSEAASGVSNDTAVDFREALNQQGAFIHKIRFANQKVDAKLEKIAMREIPTPASLVGVGLSRTYNTSNILGDDMSTGLVLRPTAVSLISNKRDFGSNSLIGLLGWNGAEGETLANYSDRLAGRLGGRATQSILMLRDKLREMEVRADLARYQGPSDPRYQDVSSKVLIRRLIERHGMSEETWSKSTLLKFLSDLMREDARLETLLAHAVEKIDHFDNDEQLKRYLAPSPTPCREGRYSEEYRTCSAIAAPSECLLMPTLDDIIGVSVEIGFEHSVDQAFNVRDQVAKRRGVSRDQLQALLPPIIQCISDKRNSGLIPLDWKEDLRPWRRFALKEFVCTGAVTQEDGLRSIPDHFRLLHKLSVWGELRIMGRMHQSGFFRFHLPGQAPDKLKEMGPHWQSNALVAGLKYGRSEEQLRFVFHFGSSDKLGWLDAWRYRKHPAMPMLSRLIKASAAEREADRVELIAARFAAIGPKKDVTYSMRSGREESGTARFIPELMSHRVTEGSHHLEFDPDRRWEGLYRYCPDKQDLRMVLGGEYVKGRLARHGVFGGEGRLLVGCEFADSGFATSWICARDGGSEISLSSFGHEIVFDADPQPTRLRLNLRGLDGDGVCSIDIEVRDIEQKQALIEALTEARQDFGLTQLGQLREAIAQSGRHDVARALDARITQYLDTLDAWLKQPAPAHQLSMTNELEQRSPGLLERFGALRAQIHG